MLKHVLTFGATYRRLYHYILGALAAWSPIEFTNWKVWHRREAVVQEAHVGVALDIALVTVLGVTVLEELALEVRTRLHVLKYRVSLGGGFKYFHPYLGKLPILTTVIFVQLGWNHHLDQHFPTEMGWKISWIRSQKLCEAAQKLYTWGLDQVGGQHVVVNVQTPVPPKNVMDF